VQIALCSDVHRVRPVLLSPTVQCVQGCPPSDEHLGQGDSITPVDAEYERTTRLHKNNAAAYGIE
jgi:hypothetical protein